MIYMCIVVAVAAAVHALILSRLPCRDVPATFRVMYVFLWIVVFLEFALAALFAWQ